MAFQGPEDRTPERRFKMPRLPQNFSVATTCCRTANEIIRSNSVKRKTCRSSPQRHICRASSVVSECLSEIIAIGIPYNWLCVASLFQLSVTSSHEGDGMGLSLGEVGKNHTELSTQGPDQHCMSRRTNEHTDSQTQFDKL